MDMVGHGRIMGILSKACHGEPFTKEELLIGNIDRRNLIPLLGDTYEPDSGNEASHLVFKPRPEAGPARFAENPSQQTQTQSSTPGPCTWAHFTFRAASPAALRFIATATKPSSTPFISFDDVLSAFAWQAVARARLPRLSPLTESTLARAINLPPYMDTIPNTYPGLMQNMVMSKFTLSALTTSTLGTISAALHSTLTEETPNIQYQTRALAMVVPRTPNKQEIFDTNFLNLSKDISVSSWSRLNCHELDFGLGLGPPEAVRRPGFMPIEGLVYFLPRAVDGEIGVAVCLMGEDMARLKADAVFGRYAVLVG
ncbi:hypothetical protein BDV10DRAFT_74 [Aspergillus recurvatus]